MKLTHTTEKVVRALLKANDKKLDIWQLARQCGYLLDVIHAVEFLKNAHAVKLTDSTITLRATDKLPRYVLQREKSIDHIVEEYTRYRKKVSFGDDRYDQLALLPGAVRNKLTVMTRECDLLNRDILCLGDDDLFSIACALTGLPKSVTVFDIDANILSFLKKASLKLPVRIKTVNVNLLGSLPKKYENAFDVFITEPPDTVKGVLLFLSQGMRALRRGGVFYLGMTGMTLARRQWHIIERAVVKSGAVFTDIMKDYEEYETDNELIWRGFEKLPSWISKPSRESWFVSTLFRAQLVNEKKPPTISFKNIERELITSLLP